MIVRRSWLLLFTLLLFAVVSCQQKADHGADEIAIGAVLPLTGPVASYGKNAQAGLDLALEGINSSRARKIRIIYEDDAGSVQNAIAATQKLISTNQVPAIVGEAASGFSLAIAPICNRAKVVLCSPISSAAELTTEGGEYFFRVCPSDAFQAKDLASWLLADSLYRVSVLFVNNSWGVSLKDEFLSHYSDNGGTVLAVEACKEGDRDFRTIITKLMKPDVQGLVVFTYGKEGGPFLKQARDLGVDVPLFGGDVWGSPELVETAGAAAEGIYFTFPAEPKGEMFDSFAASFNTKYGRAPDVYASYSYDLAHILAAALASGATTGEQIRAYLLL